MAVIPVKLTSESFHHLMQIVEAAIDTTISPIQVKAAFRPLVRALYQMVVVASVTPHGSAIPIPTEDAGAGGELRITLPRVLNATEVAMVNHLDQMETACADSIRDTNMNAGHKLVLEV